MSICIDCLLINDSCRRSRANWTHKKISAAASASQPTIVADGALLVTLVEGVTDYSDLPTLLVERGYRLTLFKEDELNLETAFMALTQGITS